MPRTRGRWKNKTPDEVRAEMIQLATHKNAAMTPDERKLHARMMVRARGRWENDMKTGKKIYVRSK